VSRIAYTVTAMFPDRATADEYIAWLEDGHIDAVIAGGAHSAMIVRLETTDPDEPPRVEVRYIFSTRELFDRYIEHFAPALRAEGLRRFPPSRGITFQRSIGTIV